MRGAPRLAQQLGVPVLTAPGTWSRLAPRMEEATHRALGVCARVELGPFTIEAIEVALKRGSGRLAGSAQPRRPMPRAIRLAHSTTPTSTAIHAMSASAARPPSGGAMRSAGASSSPR